jgi:hypothetical protein
MSAKFVSKAAVSGARRLAREWNMKIAIPTKEHWTNAFGEKQRVYLVPVKRIIRSERAYTHYRDEDLASHNLSKAGWTPSQADYTARTSVNKVNFFRKALRQGKFNIIPPITLDKSRGRMFSMPDGHHRLTAHQAEGKRLIRATFR